MSEAEFDSYLSLLAKFLRLRSRQRADLADELRDHLDSRLEELLASGKTREQAVAVALEEFGDAAVLATEFSRLASRRTRRFVMRCTAASAAVVAAVLLISVALAPPGPNGPGPGQVAAQGDGGGAGGGIPGEPSGLGGVPAVPDKASIEQQAVAALDEKLTKPVKAEFEGVALRAVLESIANEVEADVLVAEADLTDAGVQVDEPVTLKLTRTPLAARTVLGFVLEPLDLTFVNRSGVIYVTTPELADELLVTKVYNIRDVIENATEHAVMEWSAAGGGGLGGSGFFSVADAAALGLAGVGQIGGGLGGAGDAVQGGGAGGLGGTGSPGWNRRVTGPAAELIHVIHQTMSGPWFEIDGTGGSVTVFNGLLVVRQTEENHAEIQKLLDALRQAGGRQPGGSVVVPKGKPAMEGLPGTMPGGGAPGGGLLPFERGVAPGGGSPPGLGGSEEEQGSAWRDLGLRVAFLSEEEHKNAIEGSKYRGGLKVTEVRSDGPAAEADVQVGDVLVGLHDWEVTSAENIDWALKNLPSDSRRNLRLHLIRGGETRVSEVRLGSAAVPASEASGARREWPSLGLFTAAVENPKWAGGEGNFPPSHTTPLGLRVERIDPGGPADRAGLRPGDVLVTWAADSWKASDSNANLMAFDGRTLPDPAELDESVARKHDVKAIGFRLTRADSEGLRRLRFTRLTFDDAKVGK